MACNENIIKNMANEITRNCQAANISVDTEFVVYIIDLLLLNPKYGKLFSRTINRNNLQFFVEECVNIFVESGTSLNTLKMQFLVQCNYNKLDVLISKHLSSIETCLHPLVKEILDADPDPNEEPDMRKLFRKISIYIILASGLGNPGTIVILKEGMAALESVFSLHDLKVFLALPRSEKVDQLNELMEVACGVRLFNRDCMKGGEGIPDLPFNLVDASKGCLSQLSNSLIMVMQRVNMLSTAVEDCMTIEDETGCVVLNPISGLNESDYKELFDLLVFYRQYEVINRKILIDVERMVHSSSSQVEKFKLALEEIHDAVKYKAAVPIATVFMNKAVEYLPLLAVHVHSTRVGTSRDEDYVYATVTDTENRKVWRIWRTMQNVMYLVSVVSKMIGALSGILDVVGAPKELIQTALRGRKVVSDQDRLNMRPSAMPPGRTAGPSGQQNSSQGDSLQDEHVQYLGFCAMCLCGGALIPANTRVGFVYSDRRRRYAFCNVRMATRFSQDPPRYINEVLEYARNNPHLINFLNIVDDVYKVKDVDTLLVKRVAPTHVFDKDVQTETHPHAVYVEKNYSWDLWEWKRRACQWANIVNCQTHSTQTHYSHLRSEIHCQTYEMKDQMMQTKKDSGVNTDPNNVFLWGLRGQLGYGQRAMKLLGETTAERKGAQAIAFCKSPCVASINTEHIEEKEEPVEVTNISEWSY